MALSLALGFALSLTATELLLWALGKGRPPGRSWDLYERDSVLGWKSKEGRFILPGKSTKAATIRVTTILPEGQRATSSESAGPGRRIVALVGCSYTQGWELSDDETYAWKLQQKHPEVSFRNFATAGYGSYQTLLKLERLFRGPASDCPSMVIYGMIALHEHRNVAADDWLFALHRANRVDVDPPFCTLDASGALHRHPPECSWFPIPLSRSLRTVCIIENTINKWRLRSRRRTIAYQRAVTEMLVFEMNEVCRSHRADFIVALLEMNDVVKSQYATVFHARHLDFVDCTHPNTQSSEWRMSDGHPNAALNTIWAADLSRVLGPRFVALGTSPRPEKASHPPTSQVSLK
jgi:hypothetical protein